MTPKQHSAYSGVGSTVGARWGGGSFGAPERRRRDVEPYVVELSLLYYSRVS